MFVPLQDDPSAASSNPSPQAHLENRINPVADPEISERGAKKHEI